MRESKDSPSLSHPYSEEESFGYVFSKQGLECGFNLNTNILQDLLQRHIPQPQAAKIQSFYKETFNTYLNFHRPCGFATETVDNKGKIKKKYDTYLTPFEKLNRLTHPEQFLKQGVTLDQLEKTARS